MLSLVAPVPAAERWAPVKGRIMTQWGRQVVPTDVLPEYPRPMMVRKDWLNLNGLWDFAIARKDDPRPARLAKRILVPFPPESALSGVGHVVRPEERIWYKRGFAVPKAWSGRRVMLNFGAVDYEATVWVNGKEVGKHRGGYDPFSLDITNALRPSGDQEIVLAAWDPTDSEGIVHGKQTLQPGGCTYTPTSGIWQTVWLEPVASAHVSSYKAVPDIDAQVLRVSVGAKAAGRTAVVTVEALDGRRTVAKVSGRPGEEIVVPVRNPKLWSPYSPFLYDLKVTLADGGKKLDSFTSYFGMRKISLMKDPHGISRLALNNKILFQYGPLDQGFWPDGIYTAPSDAANRNDIELIKTFGANMLRKHVKVEPQRLYYWADKLGLLIWQDMVSGGNPPELRAQFEDEFRRMVESLYNHPSIVMWVCFNEGWGQYDTARVANMVRKWDPSRLISNASGWSDEKAGDVIDVHIYPGPGMPASDPDRAMVLGEFGGVGGTYMGHYWANSGNFAYKPVLDISAATDAYISLLAKLPALISRGLSAAVYTQVTDVEVEVNGWMTYDRALAKLDVESVSEIARRLHGIELEPKVILDSAQQSPQLWRYTFDLPNPSWVTEDFDDSGWKAGSSGFGAVGIPDLNVGTPWSTADVWVRKRFTLDSVPQRPYLNILHDDEAIVYINGKYANTYPGPVTGYSLEPIYGTAAKALRKGTNTVAIWFRNFNGPQGGDCGIIDLIELRSKPTEGEVN